MEYVSMRRATSTLLAGCYTEVRREALMYPYTRV